MRRQVVRIANSLAVDREVIVEPWGMPLALPPGAALEIEFEGPKDGVAEVEEDGPRVAVYGWPGSRALARCGDEVVFDGRGIAVPSLPASMSMRDFVRLLFGGAGAS